LCRTHRCELMVAYKQASWLLKISLHALDYLPWRYSLESVERKIFSQQPESHGGKGNTKQDVVGFGRKCAIPTSTPSGR
jgi:hypothetical protein